MLLESYVKFPDLVSWVLLQKLRFVVEPVWVFRSFGNRPDDKSAFKEDIFILKK